MSYSDDNKNSWKLIDDISRAIDPEWRSFDCDRSKFDNYNLYRKIKKLELIHFLRMPGNADIDFKWEVNEFERDVCVDHYIVTESVFCWKGTFYKIKYSITSADGLIVDSSFGVEKVERQEKIVYVYE